LGRLTAQLDQQLGSELRQALLQLGVESRKVQLVELPEVGTVSQVHGVKPVYELIGDVLAEYVIKPLG
jgi:hypothetical protein